MSNGAYAGLRLAARAAEPDPENDPAEIEPDDDEDDASPPKGRSKKDKKPMTTNSNDEQVAQARADGMKAERDRFNTVLASEHFAGREDLAKTLLGTDLSAEQITVALASAPHAGAALLQTSAVASDAEAAARAEMREAISQNANSSIDAKPSGSAEGADTTAAAKGWGSATANANRMAGY